MSSEDVERIDHDLREEIDRDLGLGSRVTERSTVRFLNRDGTFNVRREGFGFFRSRNLYHWLLTIRWPHFHFIVATYYAIANLFFAFAYLAAGPQALRGAEGSTFGDRFFEAFFFSVQTLATIGYGRMSPDGLVANILVSIEALVGLLGFAMITGILFSRFARPTAQILYSEHAVIAPYRGATAFEFRLANERSNQLIDVQATVVLSRIERTPAGPARKFYPLRLEREKVIFLPLHWVVVHPIDQHSPLWGCSEEELRAADAEFLILLTATDETFSTVVHSRSSYKHHEVIWNASFGDMFQEREDGVLAIDLRRIHTIRTP